MIKHVSAAQCNSLLILLTCHSVQQNNSQYGSRAYRFMTSEASRMEGVENIFFYGLEYEFRYESLTRFFFP